jgi:uncharacterized RDD family membrane protein YckC
MTQADATTDRYAPPQAHVEDVAAPSTGEPVLAGRGRRLVAAIVDAGVGFVIFWTVRALVPWLGLKDVAAGHSPRIIAVGFILFMAVHGWLLLKRGQTVGKAVLGLRIVRTDGNAATGWDLIGKRYGVGWLIALIPIAGGIYGLVDSLFIFSKSRRCLHDHIAGTIVVNA